MAHALTTRSAYDLIKSAVTTLGNDELAEKIAASTEAAIELARQTAIAALDNKDAAVITSVEVTVRHRSDDVESPPVRSAFAAREPIDSGPKGRVPIACGGRSCWTVCYPTHCASICINWECASK